MPEQMAVLRSLLATCLRCERANSTYRMLRANTMHRVAFSWKPIFKLQKIVEGIKARLASTKVL